VQLLDLAVNFAKNVSIARNWVWTKGETMDMKAAGMRTIEVFGSETLRFRPDLVSLTFSVTSKSIDANDAVANVVSKSEKIIDGLNKWNLVRVDSSQARLQKRSESKSEVVFFESSMVSHVTTPDVDQLADIQLKVVELGAENILNTEFASTNLKAHRKQARMDAMKAAVDKATYYCEAAGVKLGPPITIDDVDPTSLERMQFGHARQPHLEELASDESSDETIVVSGAVRVLFEIVVDQ
jgi:uncharacterized protein